MADRDSSTTNRFLVVCGGSGYKLLGQRDILGVAAELQVDVRKENVSRDWQVKDTRSLFVDLDKTVGTTAIAFNTMSEELHKNPNASVEDMRHADLLMNFGPPAADLEFGLAQSPAVGRAAIEHPNNRDALEQAIQTMINTFGQNIGPENPVEVWIVSSTAGGTGEGTHTYVARKFAEFQVKNRPDTPFKLNFIRVGQLTYNSVDSRKTALNTFMGVAQDSAFMLGMKADYPMISTSWFYTDLPDVGSGERAKRTRGEIVEMACKAIMLPELQEDLKKLLVNNGGAPVVLVRTGYWGRDFGQSQKYYETLKQLIIKLTDLTEPNYLRKYVEGNPTPLFNAPGLNEHLRNVASVEYVIKHMEDKWTFGETKGAVNAKDINLVITLVNGWKNNMKNLIDAEIDHIPVEFRVDDIRPAGDGSQRVTMLLSVPNNINEDQDWFTQINNTQRVKAWADSMLGVDPKSGEVGQTGLIGSLISQADAIAKGLNRFDLFTNSQKRAEGAASKLSDFLTTLAQVNRLIELEVAATRLLDVELRETKEVLAKAKDEFEIAKNTVGASSTNVVRAAGLSDVLDQLTHKTWLRILRDAIRKGDNDLFHNEVLRGATGLTEDGLRTVLGLQSTSDVIDIQNTLAKNIGRMLGDNKEEFEGQWWQAVPVPVKKEFAFRILPQVDRELQAKLQARANDDAVQYRYVFTGFGTIGLYVLAFHGVSLTKTDGDTTTAPAFLLKPLVGKLREALLNWPTKLEANMPSGQLQVGSAGCVGEALNERALKEAGLTEEEIKKLGQYYKMYK